MRPRGRDKRPLDIEDLARTLPGGPRPEHGVQSLLLHIILYIELLQRRIQDAQNRLIPHSSQGASLPPGTTRCPANVTHKPGKFQQRPRKRCHPKGSVKKAQLNNKEATMRQTLVPYVSSSSSDNGDTGPWLVSVSVSPGPCTPKPSTSSAPYLDLSPSLLSSPADDVLQGGSPHVLFEEVQIGSSSSLDVEESAVPPAFSLDHSYQSQSECSARVSGPWNYTKKPEDEANAAAKLQRQNQWPWAEINTSAGLGRPHQVPRTAGKDGRLLARSSSSSSDDSDTRSPRRGVSAGRGLTQRFSRLQHLRKKCVNGFIMFCRLNRRLYLSAHPGKASTTATKDLAELWKVMSAQERRPYCIKARQFSLLHNRLVKHGAPGIPHEDVSPPKPLSVLLAEKAVLPLTH